MAGLSNGAAFVNLIGARVARALTFTPGYTKPGTTERTPHKCYIPVMVNPRKAKEPSIFTITAWGDKLVPLFCFYLQKGKEIHFLNAVISTFKWQVTNKEGRLMVNDDGTPLMDDRLSITCRQFIWGADSEDMRRQAALEVQQGLRPADWEVPNSPGRTQWLAQQAILVSQPYTGGPTYGKANVSKKSLIAQGGNAYNPNAYAATPGGTIVRPPAPPAPPINIVDRNASALRVNGFSYEDMIAAGWNDAQLKANALYAPLVTAHQAMAAAGMAGGRETAF